MNLNDLCKDKDCIGFHYVLIKTLICTLLLAELDIFLKMYQTKSKINPSHTTYLVYNLMILLCANFTVLLSQNI